MTVERGKLYQLPTAESPGWWAMTLEELGGWEQPVPMALLVGYDLVTGDFADANHNAWTVSLWVPSKQGGELVTFDGAQIDAFYIGEEAQAIPMDALRELLE